MSETWRLGDFRRDPIPCPWAAPQLVTQRAGAGTLVIGSDGVPAKEWPIRRRWAFAWALARQVDAAPFAELGRWGWRWGVDLYTEAFMALAVLDAVRSREAECDANLDRAPGTPLQRWWRRSCRRGRLP